MSNPNIPDELEDLDDDISVDDVPAACEWGMAGWCSMGKHHRCYFNTPEGAAAYRAGTYSGPTNGHRWACQCICHADQDLPDCPSPDHSADHRRTLLGGDVAVQAALF